MMHSLLDSLQSLWSAWCRHSYMRKMACMLVSAARLPHPEGVRAFCQVSSLLCCPTGMLLVQVLSFSGGQRKEEDLTSALVAAVAAARTEAGTYGVESPGEHLEPAHSTQRANLDFNLP